MQDHKQSSDTSSEMSSNTSIEMRSDTSSEMSSDTTSEKKTDLANLVTHPAVGSRHTSNPRQAQQSSILLSLTQVIQMPGPVIPGVETWIWKVLLIQMSLITMISTQILTI